MMAKRTDRQVWAALEEDALDAEMDAVLAMTPEERRRELKAAGFDLDKVHAQADAIGAELAPQAAAKPMQPARMTIMRPKRRRMVIIVPVVIALAAGIAVVVSPYVTDQGVSAHRPDDTPIERARALREQARDDCDARRWEACLQKLDDARALDPQGDGAEDVQSTRRTAGDALHPK
jgi:hypothetical protein